MGLKCGIVGLPNVGKSTLFNAITESEKAQSANFPFCTIEPNTGMVDIYDKRLEEIANIQASQKTIYNKLEFVDIAGLVKNAHKGEGLGNQFLGNIRNIDAILHVVRCFEDEKIIHVDGFIDPVRDAEIVNMELLIADIESLENRLIKLEKQVKAQNKEAIAIKKVINTVLDGLKAGSPARNLKETIEQDEQKILKELTLLSYKPVIYVCNVAEDDAKSGNSLTTKVEEMAKEEGAETVIISAQIENEIAKLGSKEEKQEFLNYLGLEETGLNKIAKKSYDILGLQTFFTLGPKEARAWSFPKGALAPQCAGVIHSDFERGFISAEVVSLQDFLEYRSFAKAKEAGKLKQEGKNYSMQEGDIVHFLFNV